MDTKQENQVRLQVKDSLLVDIFKEVENFIIFLKWVRYEGATEAEALNPLDLTYITDADIEPFLLRSDTLIRKRRNDVSFITKDGRLIILIEHQTIITQNLALKIFLYYMELIQLWLVKNDVNIHSTKKINIPKPEMYIVYNGKKELEESFSTFTLDSIPLSIKANIKILDIRYDNLNIKEPSNPLVGYSFFIKNYDQYQEQGLSRDEAFDKARQECIKKGYLKGFIEREDFIMYKKIFDYEEQLKAEGMMEGIEKGIEEGLEKGIEKGIEEGIEKGIRKAIECNCPLDVLEAMAHGGNISRERLNQLIEEVKSTLTV